MSGTPLCAYSAVLCCILEMLISTAKPPKGINKAVWLSVCQSQSWSDGQLHQFNAHRQKPPATLAHTVSVLLPCRQMYTHILDNESQVSQKCSFQTCCEATTLMIVMYISLLTFKLKEYFHSKYYFSAFWALEHDWKLQNKWRCQTESVSVLLLIQLSWNGDGEILAEISQSSMFHCQDEKRCWSSPRNGCLFNSVSNYLNTKCGES